MGMTQKDKNVAIGAFNSVSRTLPLRDALNYAIEEVLNRHAPTPSVAQADWDDQHGHRSTQPFPVSSDLLDVAAVASGLTRGTPREKLAAVIRVIADKLLGPVTPKEDEEFMGFHGGRMASMQNFVDRRRARIEAKPKTLEERVIDILKTDHAQINNGRTPIDATAAKIVAELARERHEDK